MQKFNFERARIGLGIIFAMGGLYFILQNKVLIGIILLGIGMFMIGM